jgi:hypothetical protein
MSDRFTVMHDPQLHACIKQTFEGQAHFARWKASSEIYGACRFWTGSNGGSQAPCAKFVELTGVKSKRVPVGAWACRHFERCDGKGERVPRRSRALSPWH